MPVVPGSWRAEAEAAHILMYLAGKGELAADVPTIR